MVKCWLCNQAPGKGPEGVCGGCSGSALAVAPDPFVTGGLVSEPLCYPTDEGLEIHAPVVDEDWLQPHNTPLDPTLQGGLVPASNLTNKNKITQKKTGESARFASRGSPIVYPECGVFSPLSEKSSKRKQPTRDSSATADIENIPTKSPRLTSKSKRDENYVIKESVPAQVAMPASSQPGLVPGRGKGRGKGRGRGRAQARDQWSNFAHRSPLDSIYPSPKGGEGWKSRGKPRGKHTLRGRGRSTVCRTVTQEVEGPTCRPSASMGAPPARLEIRCLSRTLSGTNHGLTGTSQFVPVILSATYFQKSISIQLFLSLFLLKKSIFDCMTGTIIQMSGTIVLVPDM